MIHRVFVVEADLAADTRDSDCSEIVGDCANRFFECPVDLGIPGVSKLEMINDSSRFGRLQRLDCRMLPRQSHGSQ